MDTILECACHAPSAMNAQNWHFTAIRDVAVIERLNGWIVAEIKESGNPYLQVILERADGKVFKNPPASSWSQRKNKTGWPLSMLARQ